ncbi:MerR family DNA-binding protein [Streptomyces sp. TLI_171]|uniref:MerR family DNA-binding protein n=1 Tax=Streptomyces sp. TLI_171 TaxID=1938859 RepID=UPI002877C204|nr:MerR family DNA-binding protein [Streptomyces sp. TLI_171]
MLPAERTPAGYRVYGQQAVERLEFISSAKLLGLPLEEIRGLLDVREQGACAPVRSRMRALVADRIADTDARIAELTAFSARLADVHATLEGPAPAGACGPQRGCTGNPATGATLHLSPTRTLAHPEPGTGHDRPEVAPESDPARDSGPHAGAGSNSGPDQGAEPAEAWRQAPVACTLGGERLGARVAQWQELIAEAVGRETIPDGLRLTFPAHPGLVGRLAELATAEQGCCAFFDFTLRLTPSTVHLSVRAPEEGAELLADLFGVTS